MKFARILYEKKEGVAYATLNRPEVLNCVDLQTLLDLEEAYEDLEADASIKAGVVSAVGDVFCSGADLKFIKGHTPGEVARFVRKYHYVINRMGTLTKPLVAAIHGKCLAGGLELAMGCDILVAEETAKIGDHHANIGAIPGGGGEQRLARIIGVKRAMDLVLTGRWITAADAERWGLVSWVAPAGKLDETVKKVTDLLVNKSPWALKNGKYLMNQGLQADLGTGLEMELHDVLQQFVPLMPDTSKGISAFVGKEKQAFWTKKE